MESIKELRKICQDKGYKEHPILGCYRIFSIYITKVFIILRIKPNLVTVSGVLLGIGGGYLYLKGDFVLGSILFFAFMVFDFVDGEIARYRRLSSTLGAWLDTMSAHLLYPYFFFTLGLGVFFQTGELCYIILGSLAAMAKLIERSVFRSSIKANKPGKVLKSQNIILVKEWVGHIGKNVVLYPVILLCSIMGWEIYFLWFFVIYLVFFASGKIILTGWRIYSSEKC